MKAPDKVYITREKNGVVYSLSFNDNGGFEFIRKDALLEFINEKLQESADRLDFRTNKAYAEVLDKLNNFNP